MIEKFRESLTEKIDYFPINVTNYNCTNMCCEKNCNKKYTHFITANLFGTELLIPVCKEHSEQMIHMKMFKEHGFQDEVDNNEIPILLCKDNGSNYYFYCKYCQKIHKHGRQEGHRVAHCTNEYSPYHIKGYVLKLESKNDEHCKGGSYE